jgi:hypothetical protein
MFNVTNTESVIIDIYCTFRTQKDKITWRTTQILDLSQRSFRMQCFGSVFSTVNPDQYPGILVNQVPDPDPDQGFIYDNIIIEAGFD